MVKSGIWLPVLLGFLCGNPPIGVYRSSEANISEEAFLAAVAEPDTERAIDLWSAFIVREGASASALCERAKRYNRSGRDGLAIRDLAQAMTLNCRKCSANLHYQFAFAYSAQRRFDRALNELELATTYLNQGKDLRAYDIRAHDVNEMKAWIRFEQGEYQRALDSIDLAIEDSESSRVSRSALLICLGKGTQAGIDAENLLASWVRMSPEKVNLAVLGYFGFANQGENDRARLLVRKARDLAMTVGERHPVLDYLAGEMTANDFYHTATDDCKMTDAQCYLALRQLNAGKTADAPTHLKWIARNGARDRVTFRLAVAALNGWPQKNGVLEIKPVVPAVIRSKGQPSRVLGIPNGS